MNYGSAIRSNTFGAKPKSSQGRWSLFDAVPFFGFPHLVAPRPFCVKAPEKEKRNGAKEMVKFANS
jgi:hypothetical protein